MLGNDLSLRLRVQEWQRQPGAMAWAPFGAERLRWLLALAVRRDELVSVHDVRLGRR